MTARRKSVRIVLALLLLGALSAAWIGSLLYRARQVLEEHRLQARNLLETIPPETTQRPALFDPPEPGDAWELEAIAFERIMGPPLYPEDPPLMHRFVTFGVKDSFPLTDPDLSKRVEKTEGHLDLLRSALRRRTVAPTKRPGWITTANAERIAAFLRHSATEHHQQGADLAAFERLVISIGQAQDVARHGDRSAWSMLLGAESFGALAAKDILESHSLSTEDLRTVARWLDRLAAARPSLAHAMTIDGALERRFAVDPSFKRAVEVDILTPKTPTWRELWSSTLHDAKRASSLARASQTLEGLDSLPVWDRERAANRRLAPQDFPGCQKWELPNTYIYQADARILTYLALLRICVAVAWYESEHERFPSEFQDLVPKHLPALPPCPFTGRPFLLQNNRVQFEVPAEYKASPDDDTELTEKTSAWTVGRRR